MFRANSHTGIKNLKPSRERLWIFPDSKAFRSISRVEIFLKIITKFLSFRKRFNYNAEKPLWLKKNINLKRSRGRLWFLPETKAFRGVYRFENFIKILARVFSLGKRFSCNAENHFYSWEKSKSMNIDI